MAWILDHPVAWAALIGLVGAGVGGLIGVAVGQPRPRVLSLLMNATGGLMLAVSCFDLLPEAYILSVGWGLLGMLLGVLVMLTADALMHRGMPGHGAQHNLRRTGLLVAAGIALHNLPEGLAIGSGFVKAPELGIALGLLIALHDVPEGIASTVPLRAAGSKAWRVLVLVLLSGLPTGLGAYIGMALGGISPAMIALCLGLAGGAMLQVTAQELLPTAGALYAGWDANLALTLGVAAGSAVTLLVH